MFVSGAQHAMFLIAQFVPLCVEVRLIASVIGFAVCHYAMLQSARTQYLHFPIGFERPRIIGPVAICAWHKALEERETAATRLMSIIVRWHRAGVLLEKKNQNCHTRLRAVILWCICAARLLLENHAGWQLRNRKLIWSRHFLLRSVGGQNKNHKRNLNGPRPKVIVETILTFCAFTPGFLSEFNFLRHALHFAQFVSGFSQERPQIDFHNAWRRNLGR